MIQALLGLLGNKGLMGLGKGMMDKIGSEGLMGLMGGGQQGVGGGGMVDPDNELGGGGLGEGLNDRNLEAIMKGIVGAGGSSPHAQAGQGYMQAKDMSGAPGMGELQGLMGQIRPPAQMQLGGGREMDPYLRSLMGG